MGKRFVLVAALVCGLVFGLTACVTRPPGADEEPVASDPPAAGEAAPTAEPEPAAAAPGYTSVALEGAFQSVTPSERPDSAVCSPFPPGASGCSDSVNPCSAGGGGGGGGGGADVACLRMPDHCYECMPDFGASYFFEMASPDRQYLNNVSFMLELGPTGEVTGFAWGEMIFAGHSPAQTEFAGGAGGFHVRYDLFNPNFEGKTPAYIVVDGAGIAVEITAIDLGEGQYDYQLSGLSGGGTWELGHPLFGTVATGAWSFDPGYTWYQVTP